jgi:magnesium-transporting ATPase (P-type)
MRTLQPSRRGQAALAEATAVPAADAGTLAKTALLDADRVLAGVGTGHERLLAAEAEARLSRQGPNLLPQPRGPSLARQLFDQMFHFFRHHAVDRLRACVRGPDAAAGDADHRGIVFNGLFSFAHAYRTERAIRTLSALLPEAAVVRRDGQKTRVRSAELVPGDLVLLAAAPASQPTRESSDPPA